MSKLTLSVDEAVISRAKRFAKQQGISISEMVESYLAAFSATSPKGANAAPPILRSVRGVLHKADLPEYRRHLTEKHR